MSLIKHCLAGDLEGVERTLAVHANMSERGGGSQMNALHAAVLGKSHAVLERLLRHVTERAALLFDRGTWKRNLLDGVTAATLMTPLAFAEKANDVGAARLLLRHGACLLPTDANGCAVLHRCALTSNLAMATAVLDHVATLPAPARLAVLDQFVRDDVNALGIACTQRDVPMARALLDAGAPIGTPDAEGFSPFAIAIHGDDHDELIPLMVQHLRALPRRQRAVILDQPAQESRITMLHHACVQSRARTVRLLLELGARTDLASAEGITAAQAARIQGDPQVVRAFEEHVRRPVDVVVVR